MAASHVGLPEGVYVQNTFITVRPDYDHEPIRRTRSCPPSVRAEAPTRRAGCGQAVTVLIQNLPIRGRVSSIFSHLDNLGFDGQYDYVHAPIDTRTRMLKGFAFVNFAHVADAARLMARLGGTQLEGSESKRTLCASLATNQGIEANLAALAGLRKRSRRKDAELPWVRVNGEMQPIQETAQKLTLV
jgi:hypothetical protein